MPKPNTHVVPRGDQWAVQRAGGERATRIVDTQREAIQIAKEIAQNQRIEMIVHAQNGQISWRNSYGNDPKSSKG
ncbi:DUF2188 domain-containing protein [Larkinella bovis]|uniref:DUF2188 domain-containing protein n=1 Tax=Larkinella bovis TaxID=683041 RepID=A0ABW0I9H0_9BACT